MEEPDNNRLEYKNVDLSKTNCGLFMHLVRIPRFKYFIVYKTMAYCPEAGSKDTYNFCYPPSPRSKPLDMLLL